MQLLLCSFLLPHPLLSTCHYTWHLILFLSLFFQLGIHVVLCFLHSVLPSTRFPFNQFKVVFNYYDIYSVCLIRIMITSQTIPV